MAKCEATKSRRHNFIAVSNPRSYQQEMQLRQRAQWRQRAQLFLRTSKTKSRGDSAGEPAMKVERQTGSKHKREIIAYLASCLKRSYNLINPSEFLIYERLITPAFNRYYAIMMGPMGCTQLRDTEASSIFSNLCRAIRPRLPSAVPETIAMALLWR